MRRSGCSSTSASPPTGSPNGWRAARRPRAGRCATGRLVVSNAPRFARGGFDAARLVEGARRRLDTVLAEGFTGLRSASEMSLALAPIDHLGQAVEYEIALHATLFSEQQRSRYTALCYWDERLFGGTDAMKEARSVHPVILLPRIGTLHATVSGNRVSPHRGKRPGQPGRVRRGAAVAGRTARHHARARHRRPVVLRRHSANAVLRLAAGLTAPQRLEVHCRGTHRRLLHVLGGRSVKQLSIITIRL